MYGVRPFYFLEEIIDATIIFNSVSISLYKMAISSLNFSLKTTNNFRKKRLSSYSSSTIFNLLIQSAFDFALLEAL